MVPVSALSPISSRSSSSNSSSRNYIVHTGGVIAISRILLLDRPLSPATASTHHDDTETSPTPDDTDAIMVASKLAGKPRQINQVKPFRKFPLTTKDINKGFYKGTGSGSMGRHTKFGGYVIDWQKVRTYVVPPEMNSFKVSMSRREKEGRRRRRGGKRGGGRFP